jgi:5'-nucleotidase
MKFFLTIIAFAVLIPFHSCSTRQGMSYNQRADGHYQLYTFPEYKDQYEASKRYRRLVLVSLNDLNGQVDAFENSYTDTRFNNKKTIRSGGISGIKAYLDILHHKFPKETLVLDSGSFLGRNSNYSQSIFLYNYLGVDFATLGSNEFMLKENENLLHLQNMISKANFPVITSNLINLKTAQTPQWKNLHQSYIKNINGIRVGIIGLMSPTLATKIPADKLNGLYFQNLPKTIIQTSKVLRQQGAQVIVTLFHSPLDCTSNPMQKLNLPAEKVNFIPSDTSVCDSEDNEVIKTLAQVPSDTIDAVITGGVKSKVANYLYGIPVMQNFGDGQYLSWMEITFDTKLSRVVKEKTNLHQPIHLCHNFVEDNKDCYMREEISKLEVEQASFMQTLVYPGDIPRQ